MIEYIYVYVHFLSGEKKKNHAHDLLQMEQINLVLSTAKNPVKDTILLMGEKNYNPICD